MNTEKHFEDWKRIEPFTFFDPEINGVTTANEYYDIKPLMNPFQVKFSWFYDLLNIVSFKVCRKVVDKCQPDMALPYLKFKVSLKHKNEPPDLALTFKRISQPLTLVIPSYDLKQAQKTTSERQ